MRKFTKEHIANLSLAHKGQKSWNKGKKLPYQIWNKGIRYTDKLKSRLNLDGLSLGWGWNKGKKLSKKHRENLSKSHQGPRPWRIGVPVLGMRGEKHPLWKGKNVGYEALHTWVYRTFGKPKSCEYKGCNYPRLNMRGKLMEFPKRFEWANKTGKYLRDRSDWLMLCPSCHRFYDNKFNVRKP